MKFLIHIIWLLCRIPSSITVSTLCGEFANSSTSYLGRVFNNKFIDNDETSGVFLASVFLCDRYCNMTRGCLAVDYDKRTKICRLFNLTSINNYINDKERSYVIIKLPMECKEENRVDGEWGPWYNDWSCSRSCPTVGMVQRRQCIEPTCNGNQCQGDTEREFVCNDHQCILQRRFDGSVSFSRGWNEYIDGFGDINGEFWLGLENAYNYMAGRNVTLRFDMWDENDHAFMEYYEATISDLADNYRLDYKGMFGNAGDSMSTKSKGKMFSTHDVDNDKTSVYNCARSYGGGGGWWYGACKDANLNGKYDTNTRWGVVWYSFKGQSHSISETEIRIILN